MSDLTIVMMHGKMFVGIRIGPNLTGALELQAGMVQTPQGLGIVINAVPIAMLTSLTSIAVDGLVVALEDLDKHDRRTVEKAYESGQKMVTAMRAASSGIVLPSQDAAKQLLDRARSNGGAR